MTVRTTDYALAFDEIDETLVAVVGGKGAGLAALARIDGVSVPPGFCVTTAAFERIMAGAPGIDARLDRLARVDPGDRETIRDLSAEIREVIEGIAVPHDIAGAITRQLVRLGEQVACAVRSSATAEDLPTASFAGQQDSYLNVVGPAAILQHVSRCWASLFTERAVTYRVRNGFDHRRVRMAVVVQQMVFPDAAGVLFTADPVTGNRKVVSVEATFGLGEALVSGRVNADVYTVRDGAIVTTTVGAKELAVLAAPSGGTREQAIEPARQEQPALTDAQVLRLADLGRRIEAHAGCPQDIEWCLAGDDIQIVQSRPITTLFPVPAVDDGENHVYISVGHQQMMTDPMRPLGLSVWQLTSPAPMRTAGGRLFVDVTVGMSSPVSRAGLLEAMGRSDPLIRDAMQTVVDRGDFIPLRPDETSGGPPAGAAPDPIPTDPAIVTDLIARNEASLAALERDITTRSGEELLDFIAADIQDELRRMLFAPQSYQAIMAGMEATWWLNDQLEEWLGEKNAADTLAQSVPHNVTSEMGLALLDVADVIRPHAEVVAFLRDVSRASPRASDRSGPVDGDDERFLDELATLPGGPAAVAAIRSYLDSYGMRCVGEIDITRPRWAERPVTLVPVILGNIDNFQPGEGARRFERGRQEAADEGSGNCWRACRHFPTAHRRRRRPSG